MHKKTKTRIKILLLSNFRQLTQVIKNEGILQLKYWYRFNGPWRARKNAEGRCAHFETETLHPGYKDWDMVSLKNMIEKCGQNEYETIPHTWDIRIKGYFFKGVNFKINF